MTNGAANNRLLSSALLLSAVDVADAAAVRLRQGGVRQASARRKGPGLAEQRRHAARRLLRRQAVREALDKSQAPLCHLQRKNQMLSVNIAFPGAPVTSRYSESSVASKPDRWL